MPGSPGQGNRPRARASTREIPDEPYHADMSPDAHPSSHGSPRPSTPNRTRQLLLDAAREEFAAHGIDGARVDRIAALAGVNKQRIYAHFGSKEGLFDEVVRGALDEIAQAVPPEGDVVEYIGAVFDFHQEHPYLLRLLLWEALHYRQHPLPDEERRAGHYQEKVRRFAQARGVAPTREVAGDLLALIGLAAWPLAVPHLARLVLSSSQDPTPMSSREHVLSFARKALSSQEDPAAP
ncbi:MAG: hypothetical protein QG608_3707 [Actinomycetota bacterium]|nr:hypothetical protein [Actinomycetota bacterium]